MKGKKLMSESMVNALRKIIKENGEEILAENIDRVYNFLTDLVPKEETQRKCTLSFKIRGNEAAVQY